MKSKGSTLELHLKLYFLSVGEVDGIPSVAVKCVEMCIRDRCKTYRTVLDGLTSGHASEAIDYWCGWSDRVTVRYREALLQLGSE